MHWMQLVVLVLPIIANTISSVNDAICVDLLPHDSHLLINL